jgi:hypothetical protein
MGGALSAVTRVLDALWRYPSHFSSRAAAQAIAPLYPSCFLTRGGAMVLAAPNPSPIPASRRAMGIAALHPSYPRTVGQLGRPVPLRWDSITPSPTMVFRHCPTVPRGWTGGTARASGFRTIQVCSRTMTGRSASVDAGRSCGIPGGKCVMHRREFITLLAGAATASVADEVIE